MFEQIIIDCVNKSGDGYVVTCRCFCNIVCLQRIVCLLKNLEGL